MVRRAVFVMSAAEHLENEGSATVLMLAALISRAALMPALGLPSCPAAQRTDVI